jgi:hypothetical protein
VWNDATERVSVRSQSSWGVVFVVTAAISGGEAWHACAIRLLCAAKAWRLSCTHVCWSVFFREREGMGCEAYQELIWLADEQAGGGERRLLLVGSGWWCCDGLPARGGYYWGLIDNVVVDAEV